MRKITMTTIILACLAMPAVAVAQDDDSSDHSKVVGRFSVGWLGVSEIPLGVQGANAIAPAIGARYWFTESVGIDAGLGFAWSTSSQETDFNGVQTQADGPTTTGVLFRVGLPIALYHRSHYAFTFVPEINLGYATQSIVNDEADTEQNQDGLRVDVGARAGAEIHFGFIGIPELTLEASVGLFLQHINRSAESRLDGELQRRDSTSETSLNTTVNNDPWDIFRTSVAARYYF